MTRSIQTFATLSVATTGLASALAALLLSGCTVGPDYKGPPPTTLPSAFIEGSMGARTADGSLATTRESAGASTADLSVWWTAFSDPVLTDLVQTGLRQNLDLETAAARIREARATYGIATAALYPTLDSSGGVTRQRASQSGNNAGFGKTESTSWTTGLDAKWEMDVFGANRRGQEAAIRDVQAQEEDRRAVGVSVASEIVRSYVQLRGFQRQIEIARQNVQSQRDTYDLTVARVKAGLSTELDSARAYALVASTESSIPNLEAEARANAHRIAVLLGLTPDALVDKLGPIDHAPASFAIPAVPVGLPGELIQRRPDVRKAERQLAASTARIGQAKAEYFPKFTLTGNVGLTSDKFANLFDSKSIYYGFGPQFSWPIFNADRIKFNVEAKTELQYQALAAYKASVLTSLEEVENALVRFNREMIRRQFLLESVQANQKAVNLSQQRFEKGVSTFLDVLDAQRSLFTAQDQLVQSETASGTDLVALYKALGGGWEQLPPVGPRPATQP
jgi:NodT family efflux transporter outer membrane factor (OMF) lipoprotein